MKKLIVVAALATMALPLASAEAWMRAGGWSGEHGSWSASTSRGGSASGGGGSWSASGYRGGTASGGDEGAIASRAAEKGAWS